MIAVSIPLGFTFGRIGNFINGELWGKVSTAPWAMVFPHAEVFSTRLSWVRTIAEKTGCSLDSAMVNLPRHPSQLYEALFEGIVLWAILWFLFRPQRWFKGCAMGSYIIGYGFIRFIIEYFREPDADIGYVIKWGDPFASIHKFSTLFNFSMGQILCFLMMLGGGFFIWFYRKKSMPVSDTAIPPKKKKKRKPYRIN
jgi:phosphatidylglycerol:prolipoprotein diacylglycerol transferase